MKSFTDAVRIAIRYGNDAESKSAAVAAMKEVQARYDSIAEEARRDSILTDAIFAWFDIVVDERQGGDPETTALKICELFFTAFMSGLVTGIEMEKGDTASFARTNETPTDSQQP